MFPSPATNGAAVTNSDRARSRCAHANYFAPKANEKAYHRNYAQTNYGYTCPIEN
jgi:hypothetical protein